MLTFYADPGHGWLQVTGLDLKEVGLKPADFSAYSYRQRAQAIFYLEEDCDAPKFFAAYVAKHGKPPEFKEVHQQRTFIRNLPRIS